MVTAISPYLCFFVWVPRAPRLLVQLVVELLELGQLLRLRDHHELLVAELARQNAVEIHSRIGITETPNTTPTPYTNAVESPDAAP
jgi:hypothetical protein